MVPKGFTYIELIVSIVLVATIISIVSFVFNPSKYFVRARDLQRLKDLQLLANALTIYFNQSQNPDPDGPELFDRGINESDPTIFISVPYEQEEVIQKCYDPFTNQWVKIYQVSRNNLQRIDSTGWVPVNFIQLSSPPISKLPIDPINSWNYGYFYAYAFKTNPFGFEITAALEYKRFQFGGADDKVSTDGGNDPRRFEVGSDLDIISPLTIPTSTQQ